MKRKLIIAIVGESGSGKTTLAEQLRERLGIKMVESYTDRPKRTEDEIGHVFLTPEQFSELKQEDMIAYTTFGDYRYCCLFSDLEDVNSYVIDENGLRMLWKLDGVKYRIQSIRVVCSEDERIKRVGYERAVRDYGRFTIPVYAFDLIYYSEDFKSIFEFESAINTIKQWTQQ